MSLKIKALTKSLWLFHISAGSCNNCDIELLDCLTPRFDVERFGIQLVGSIRHADALVCAGVVNKKTIPMIKDLYEQAPKPCLVIALGCCACGQHMFRHSYNVEVPLDKIIPVSVYIPGCPPKPEAIIAGIVKAAGNLIKSHDKRKNKKRS